MSDFIDIEATARDAPVGIANMAIDGRYTWVNRRYAEMMGTTAEYLVGRQFGEMADSADVEESYRVLARLLSGVTETEVMERRLKRRDGSICMARIVARLHRDGLGRPKGVSTVVLDVTAEHAATLKLRSSEALLSAFLENAPVCMFVKEDTGRYLVINRQTRAAFGLGSAPVAGKTDFDLYPQEMAEQCRLSDEAVLADPLPTLADETMVVGGEARTFRTTKFTLANPVGPGRLICGISLDMTESQRKEALIRESIDRFQQVAETIDEAIFLRDLKENRVIYANRAYERIFCRPVAELYENPDAYFIHIHPDDLPGVMARRGLFRETDMCLEFRLCLPSDGMRWVQVKMTVIRDAEGVPSRLVGIVADISAQKRMRSEFEATLERFRQLADNIDDVFWMAKPQLSEMLYVSPAFERVWGIPVAKLYAHPTCWIDAIHPDDKARIHETFANFSSGTIEATYRIIRPDGSVRWVWDRGFCVLNEKGEFYRVCGIASDVTAQKEAERIITEQQAKLAASSKMAALGEMAAGLAHEINNPLAIIDGKLQLLAKLMRGGEAVPESACAIIDSVSGTTDRIARIVRSMHAFARDVSEDPFRTTALAGIIDETAGFCVERFRNHGIELAIAAVPEVRVECRAVQISQVLLNLLNNAHDAVQGLDRRWVRVTTRDAGDSVEVAVEDGGDGIPTQHRSRLFQPFFTTKEIGQGTGLGLSVSRGIAKAHGGDLVLDGRADYTRFVLTLPKTHPAAVSPGSS